MAERFQIWTCKIVVAGDVTLPDGFDQPPRRAAINAVNGVTDVLTCFSGWGGELSKEEEELVEGWTKKYREGE